VIANADDHYGTDALASAFASAKGHEHALIAFELHRTLSASGPVNRAVCTVDDLGYLVESTERMGFVCDVRKRIVDGEGSVYDGGSLVSMNLWVLQPSVHAFFMQQVWLQMTAGFPGECMLPDIMRAAIQHGAHRVRVIHTDSTWAGLTFAEDVHLLRQILIAADASKSVRLVPSWDDVLAGFGLLREEHEVRPLGNGLINRTYRVKALDGSKDRVLQRINTDVFQQPALIAQNNRLAAHHLEMHHPQLPFLRSLPTTTGAELHMAQDGGHWRMFPFIPNTVTFDGPVTPAKAFSAAQQFGRLTRCLDGADVRSFSDHSGVPRPCSAATAVPAGIGQCRCGSQGSRARSDRLPPGTCAHCGRVQSDDQR
jgi:hypothetical protein